MPINFCNEMWFFTLTSVSTMRCVLTLVVKYYVGLCSFAYEPDPNDHRLYFRFVALHYKIPYPRASNFPPFSMTAGKGRKDSDRRRRDSIPVHLRSYREKE